MLEATSRVTQFQPPAMGRAATNSTRLPKDPSNLVLISHRDGASTASLGQPIPVPQCPLHKEFLPNI